MGNAFQNLARRSNRTKEGNSTIERWKIHRNRTDKLDLNARQRAMRRGAIVAIRYSGFRSVTPNPHFHKLSFETTKKAYLDTKVYSRKDV